MRFTILENAINSLDIAIENFKLFYYGDEESLSPYLEKKYKKVSLVFLENAIELLLKSIIIEKTQNNLSIFLHTDKEPYKGIIDEARELSEKTGGKLEDCLLKNTNMQTITYTKSLSYYDEMFKANKKVSGVLKKLGYYRNAITHFGIDFSENPDELLCCFIETFDVIYNYLYPQLIELDEEASYYFEDCDENYLVETPDGIKFFFGEDGEYNNFFDFCHELLRDLSQVNLMESCRKNPNKNIQVYHNICKELINTSQYIGYFETSNLNLTLDEETRWLECEVQGYHEDAHLFPVYSSYYNATIYFDESSVAIIIPHYENKIYSYVKESNYPCLDEAENDKQWIEDLEKGNCMVQTLSTENLFIALKYWFESLKYKGFF